jgi:hypothetical protein
VLENACPRCCRREHLAADAGLVDHDQLSGLDVADELRAQEIERAGLGRDDPAFAEPSDA